ncbi:MAG: hypothetical protein IJ438_01595 [Clostridia bacterium]|nr:hypothetical protein [Clostridia bacterium]
MFFGVRITQGPSDWQVLQRRNGCAQVYLKGDWQLEKGAIKAGVRSVTPVVRVVNEMDQSLLIPWTACDRQTGEISGEWETTLTLPQGGPYRIDTSLDAVSAASGDHWMFHGDIRVHIGVGDLFCMAGQSNAAGYAKGVAFDPPDVRVHLLRNSGHWDMAAHPMNDATDAADCVNAPMGITGTSPFLSFGRRYADYAGVPVGLIQAAQGGSPMKRWDDTRDGDLLRGMLDKLEACGGVRAVIWYQGCADANENDAPVYADSFAHMVEVVRQATGECTPFFTLQLNKFTLQEDGASWAAIKEAQRQAAEKLEAVWLLPTTTLPMSDEVHNSAAGNVMLGEMLAKQVHGALNSGRPYFAPSLEKAVLEEQGIRLTFRTSGPLMRLNTRVDKEDFCIEDETGVIPVETLTLRDNELLLTPAAPLRGRVVVSYGCDPIRPMGPIIDQHTYLPVISFNKVEVSV